MNKPGRDIDIVGLLGPLRRYARSLTRNPDDAEDLVHDTLLRAVEKRDQFKAGQELRPWLMSILHNRFVDGTRRRRADRIRDDALALAAVATVDGSQEISARLHDVRRAFLSLPDEQRAALHLVTVEELSYDEAAETLGVPVGTLVSRLSRGRARLRELEDGLPEARIVPFRTRGVRDAN
ncbi:sigma-70 family RNA polymerase sigma factor [Aureimonas altamirensis]|uniref:sigma-70 family RNA polymerase sigma factor n=1 Tax=Aureimonas altamirensis TaxID=370622 RepID=UPI002036FAB5|nr:sigma-70 family RNA polymerase sigma factor [Aureimonas altamirensis]MCM2502631.1 sigma-70 family RNA polymerase sigma factor [Aureimonas altamirensis]